jgi:pimeloyl-ACP methyl ester carboxylesterase
VRVNDIQLHYLDHPGGDPPLVLMPGLTANAYSFDGLINAGLSSALRVLALDLRGRGLSDKPDSGYSMADHAADVLGLLNALEFQRVVLGGHSFWGLLTL